MPPDDDYWRWRNAEDDRRWRADRAREQTNRLYDALREGNEDIARWITGVPPAGAGRSGPAEPESAAPPTAGEQFREHKQALLFNLEWVPDFLLPRELCLDWAGRVEPLDLEQAETGLPVAEALAAEYRQAADRHEPRVTEVSRRIEWDYYVARVGREIDWLVALFRHVLSFG